ncbi:hypothetical protein FS842_011108 [Serendipita sp. 407]|nr:hypothetical protein FS842_011108 [Serendipita sp. 407]
MGPSLSPPLPTLSPSTTSKLWALMSTITPLRSLAGRSGVFDTPVEKCPPRGSAGHVTGVLPSSFSKNTSSKVSLSDGPYPSPGSPATAPINVVKARQLSNHQLATPPLTPENSLVIGQPHKLSAFAATLFPEQATTVAKYASPLQLESDSPWDGFILSLPNGSKTLYVNGKGAQLANLRESVVALLELADEELECSAVVIAIPKASGALDELIHSFMYVGGQIVTRPPFKVDASYLLIGLEI